MALLELRDVTRRFKDTLALDRVSLSLSPGEVLAVVGENGAGKSTLAKVLGGVLKPDGGELRVDGRTVRLDTPMAAFAVGVGAVHQGSHLLAHLSVAENLMLGREPRARFGFVDERGARREAERIAASTGLSLDASAPVSTLTEAEGRVVELARVITRKGRVLVLDEPSEALGPRERAWLRRALEEQIAGGRAVVYVTHDMREALEVADRVLVLRDGAVVAERDTAGLDPAELARLVAGRDLPGARMDRGERSSPGEVSTGVEALSAKGLSVPGLFGEVSFALRAGEVLGLAGRSGDGRAALLRALVGRRRGKLRGELALAGKPARIGDPGDAIRLGMGLVTQRRRMRGLALEMSLEQETFFSQLGGVASNWLMGAREREPAGGVDLYVKDLGSPIAERAELWKWLHGDLARVVLFDEPTRGAGPGARDAIHALLADLAVRGRGVLVTSPDRGELEQLCDRVLTFVEEPAG